MGSLHETLAAVRKQEEGTISVDPEFKALLDTLSPDELRELTKSCKAEGIREPLIVWKEEQVIVDGHNRFMIAQEHSLEFATKEMSFPDRAAVREWILRNQLGRRNLTKERFTYFIGQLYNQMKSEIPATEAASKLAEQFSVDERTIRRAATQATGIDKLAKIRGAMEKSKVLDGKSDYNKGELQQIGATKNEGHAKKLIERIDSKKAEKRKVTTEAKQEVSKLPTKYELIITQPNFEEASMPGIIARKPPMADNALLLVLCEDYFLEHSMELLRRWSFKHEATIVFRVNDTIDGSFSKIRHSFMLIGSKGIVAGPPKGKEPESIIATNDLTETAFKIAESLSGATSRLDMRGQRKGWSHL